MEKIITVKSATIATKDDNEWLELVDQDGKIHRIFPRVRNNDGVWVHLEKEIDILKGKITDGSINGLALKLTKEQKGTFWNIIKVEEVKDVFVKQAQEKAEDEQTNIKNRTICLAYSKDLCVAGKLGLSDAIHCAEIFYRYTTGSITIDDEQVLNFQRSLRGKDETITSKDILHSQEIPAPNAGQLSGEATGPDDAAREKALVKNAQDLMKWAAIKGKEFTPSWVRKQANIPPNAVITDKMAEKVYGEIKALMGWE